MELEENFDLESDHSAVIMTLSEKIIKRETRAALVNETTDWESFKMKLQSNINLNVSLKQMRN